MNENEQMLQVLLSYKRDNEVLKNKLVSPDHIPENTIDNVYKNSIMEVDSDEEIERELQSTVLFKRACLDETPRGNPPQRQEFNESNSMRKKKKNERYSNFEKNDTEELKGRNSTEELKGEKSSRLVMSCHSPRELIQKKLFKVNPSEEKLNSSAKFAKSKDKFFSLSKSAMTPKVNMDLFSPQKTYKIVRRRKEGNNGSNTSESQKSNDKNAKNWRF